MSIAKGRTPQFEPPAVRPGPLFPNGSIEDHRGKGCRIAKCRMRDPLPNYLAVLKESSVVSRLVLLGGVTLMALLPTLIWKIGFSSLQSTLPAWMPKRQDVFIVSALAMMTLIASTGLLAPQLGIWMWSWRFGRAAMARALLKRGFCAACRYEIGTLSAHSDGCTVCPECGAAWKLNAPQPKQAELHA